MANIEINVTQNGTTTLATAGKYCDRNVDVIVDVAGSGGGDIPDEFFLITGDCEYKFGRNNLNYLLENEPYKSKWRSQNITNAMNMFAFSSTLKEIPFALNFGGGYTNPSSGGTFGSMFMGCSALKTLPDIDNKVYPYSLSSTFNGLLNIVTIPDSWVENLCNDRMINYNNPSLGSFFYGCSRLRKIPEAFISKLYGSSASSSAYSSIYYQIFYHCFILDEVKGLPVYGFYTSNAFLNFCVNCHRVKDIIFVTNEDGTPKIATWKSQNIDLSKDQGYLAAPLTTYGIVEITADKEVTDDATYQALKNDPDWFTVKEAYSRYNHDSAVNTINSLPDTSAYLASAGGTNTIKFRGAAGSATDGGAINTLTEEEIAVAAAKGWTVSFT